MTAKQTKVATITGIATAAGNVLGLVYAFNQKKSFWGYVGYMVLGGLVVGLSANVASNLMIKNEVAAAPVE